VSAVVGRQRRLLARFDSKGRSYSSMDLISWLSPTPSPNPTGWPIRADNLAHGEGS